MAEAERGKSVPPKHKRKWRNFLLDRHFQLKYSGLLALIAFVVATGLGLVLWRTSQEALSQSHSAVREGQKVVAVSREVVEESKKVSAVVEMNIAEKYADNPALMKAFQEDSDKQDARLKAQQAGLKVQADSLKLQAVGLQRKQRTVLLSLSLALGGLVIAIFFAGIVVTHRVSGPIYKMKRGIRKVGAGDLTPPPPLRKGDELVHFFEAFAEMVDGLRTRQKAEISRLHSAIDKLGEQDAAAMADLRALASEMEAALEPQTLPPGSRA